MTIRKCFKTFFRIVCLIIVAPLMLLFFVGRLLFDEDTVFKAHSEYLALIPGKLGSYLRAAYYSTICTNTASDVALGFLTVLSHRDTEIGAGVYFGPQGNIGKCRIGANCLFGSGVHVLSGKRQHSFADPSIPIKEQGGVFEKIEIAEDCWVGNNAVIMASVGRRSVIAAGSVVTNPVPANVIAGGNPARVLRETANVKPVE